MLEVKPLEAGMLDVVSAFLQPWFGTTCTPAWLHHRFFLNPDQPEGDSGFIRGGVLFDGEQAVGFEGSIIRRGYFGQRPLTICVHSLTCIQPEHSAYYADCAMAVLRQPGVDIHLANTANEKAQRIHRGLRWLPGAASNARIACHVVSVAACAAAAVDAALPWRRGLCGRVAGFCLKGADGLLRVMQRLPRDASETVSRRLVQIDEPLFGAFWQRVLEANRGMITSRTPAELEWLFGEGLASGRDVLIGRFDGERLVGYVVVRRCHVRHGALAVGRIVDWVAVGRDRGVLADLLRDACLHARGNGLALVEIMGFPMEVQDIIGRVFRLHRAVKGNPSSFWTRDKELRASIQNDREGWFWGAVDGDRAN